MLSVVGILVNAIFTSLYRKLRYNKVMHLITKKTLKAFWDKYPDSKTALIRWTRIIEKNQFGDFSQLKLTFPSADKVGKLTVFNIGGNKYRLITAIHFNRQKIYVRHVLTHFEYDKGDWKND